MHIKLTVKKAELRLSLKLKNRVIKVYGEEQKVEKKEAEKCVPFYSAAPLA